MKRWIALSALAAACAFGQNVSRFAGIYNAANYAYGVPGGPAPLRISVGSTTTGAVGIRLVTGSVVTSDGITIYPLTVGTPVIVGSGSTMETVTPTAVSCGLTACSFVANFANTHGSGEIVASGTIGLQEALNAASVSGGAVVVDGLWAKMGGTSGMISAATVLSNTAISDNRTGQALSGGSSTPFNGGTITNRLVAAGGVSANDGSVAGDGVFLFPTFTSIGTPNTGQVMKLMVSADGKKFSQMGNSFVTTGSVGFRDPTMWKVRSTGVWYVAYTNATLSSPNATSFQIQSSPDLVNWGNQTNISLTGVLPGTQSVYAPEVVINQDGSPYNADGHYYLTVAANATASTSTGWAIYLVQSTDLTASAWNAPVLLYNYNCIDPQLVVIDSSHFDLFYADKAAGTNFVDYATSSTLTGTYTAQTTGDWLGFGQSEAPEWVYVGGGVYRLYFHLLSASDGMNWCETSTFPTGCTGNTAIIAPNAINHGNIIRTQDVGDMRQILAAKVELDQLGIQFASPMLMPAVVTFQSPLALPAVMNVGTNTGAATPRQYINNGPGGFAAPAVLNSTSNGDKEINWSTSSFKSIIGVNGNETWIQSVATGGGSISLHTGTGAADVDSVDILSGGALKSNFVVVQTVGTAVASAATIAPTKGLFHITGTAAIDTMTVPPGMSASIGGCLTVIADAAWTTTTAGNFFAAMTAVANTPYQACFDGSKWFVK